MTPEYLFFNFRIFDNEILKNDWSSRKKVQIIHYVMLKWGFALLIGLGTGLVGFFNSFAVENIAGFKLFMTTSLMSKHRYLDAFLAYAGANMCLAAATAALCAFIAPAAAGSGIPEVKAYLNGVDAQHILAPSTLFVKVNNTTILGASLPFLHKHTDKN
ncbi:chloride channel protein CLC-c-like [Glycine soja]|uniref:chloride channel protein CLC-c-like n=1 Tax=Glycine soja TaxID=3848 RepID=UPI00103A6591|nr:chloride channel protein CLC-c-like [Glycine soja]